MNAQLLLTDELIRAAIARRAASAEERDLRARVLAATVAVPQRRGWRARVDQLLVIPQRRAMLGLVVALAVLLAATVIVAVVGSHIQLPNASGRALAFISSANLWVADADGAPHLVWDMPGSMVASRPTWVDRDTLLVQEPGGGVYAVDLRTSTPRLLSEAGALLAVSADHLRAAIGLDGPDGPHLSIVEIASGLQLADALVKPAFVSPATPQIGPQHGLTGGPHAWSPDGRWLLGQGFDTDASDTSGWIYELDVQTGVIRDLARNLCCGLHKPNPVLAPDGSSVVYMNFHQASRGETCDFRCGTLWSLDPLTGVRAQLTAEAGSEVGPVFSPDGSWIGFAEYVGPGHDVAIVRSDGTGRRKVTDIGDVYAPTGNIEPYVYLAWDEDGNGLSFMRGQGMDVEHELWHITLDGQLARIGTSVMTEFAWEVRQ